MTIDEYETTIRPALAKFCGLEIAEEFDDWWKDSDGILYEYSPDPLRNPADAWALLCAMMKRDESITIQIDGNDSNRGFLCVCSTWNHRVMVARDNTLSAAIIRVAWEIVRQTAERPSGE